MSETTMTADEKLPNPQRFKWKNVAYYNTYEEANAHRDTLEGRTKVRRCGSFGSRFVVKVGTPVRETQK